MHDPYGALRLNVHTVYLSTVAPYDTVQLVATPYTVSGVPVQTTMTPRFITKDTSLTVSPTGLVRAHSVTTTSGTFVVAALTDSALGVTQVDTTFIVVTNTVPTTPLATLTIKRVPGDSNKIGVSGNFPDSLFLVATGQDGSDMRAQLASTLAVRFVSSDLNTATVTTTVLPVKQPTHPVAEAIGLVKAIQPGHVKITVSADYYGVTRTDTFSLTIGNPVIVAVNGWAVSPDTVGGSNRLVFNPSTITIGVGGTVIFSQITSTIHDDALRMDVVFDDSTAVQPSPLPTSVTHATTGAGNVAPLPPLILWSPTAHLDPACASGTDTQILCYASRSFPRAGTYHYHSVVNGTTGTIIVAAP